MDTFKQLVEMMSEATTPEDVREVAEETTNSFECGKITWTEWNIICGLIVTGFRAYGFV